MDFFSFFSSKPLIANFEIELAVSNFCKERFIALSVFLFKSEVPFIRAIVINAQMRVNVLTQCVLCFRLVSSPPEEQVVSGVLVRSSRRVTRNKCSNFPLLIINCVKELLLCSPSDLYECGLFVLVWPIYTKSKSSIFELKKSKIETANIQK